MAWWSQLAGCMVGFVFIAVMLQPVRAWLGFSIKRFYAPIDAFICGVGILTGNWVVVVFWGSHLFGCTLPDETKGTK